MRVSLRPDRLLAAYDNVTPELLQKKGIRLLLCDMRFNHHPKVESGVLEEECGALLTAFFQKLRMELRTRPKWKPKPHETTP